MQLTYDIDSVFVFDLDDTLYYERDFENSGIEYVYLQLCSKYNFQLNNYTLNDLIGNSSGWMNIILSESTNPQISKDLILDLYRNHVPTISLREDAKTFLDKLNSLSCDLCLITDGRSITQRNKLTALGIESFFKIIIISEEINSEKPSIINFKSVMDHFVGKEFIYFADNTKKDFVTPNKLNWDTVCLIDSGKNVHKQDFSLPSLFLPKRTINSFNQITLC